MFKTTKLKSRLCRGLSPRQTKSTRTAPPASFVYLAWELGYGVVRRFAIFSLGRLILRVIGRGYRCPSLQDKHILAPVGAWPATPARRPLNSASRPLSARQASRNPAMAGLRPPGYGRRANNKKLFWRPVGKSIFRQYHSYWSICSANRVRLWGC